MLPRGVRYNNPGNIIWTGTGLFAGEVGKQPDSAFAIFDTPEHGIAAIGDNLLAYEDKHGCRTVDQFIRRWSTTDQDAYVRNVAAALGVGAHDPIDVHNDATRRTMAVAIIAQECANYRYPDALVDQALGVTTQRIDVTTSKDDGPQHVLSVDQVRAAPLDPPPDDGPQFWIGGADNSNATTAPAPDGGPSYWIGGADNSNATTAPNAAAPAPSPGVTVNIGGPTMPTQQQDQPSPVASFFDAAAPVVTGILTAINPLAGALVSAFTPLAREKIANLVNKHTDNPAVGQQVADAVVAAAQAITQKQDPLEAVIAARSDPSVLAKVEADAMARVAALAPLFAQLADLDKARWAADVTSADAAAKRVSAYGPKLPTTVAKFSMSIGLLIVFALVGAMLGELFIKGDISTALIAMAGPVLMASIGDMRDIVRAIFGGQTSSDAAPAIASTVKAANPKS